MTNIWKWASFFWTNEIIENERKFSYKGCRSEKKQITDERNGSFRKMKNYRFFLKTNERKKRSKVIQTNMKRRKFFTWSKNFQKIWIKQWSFSIEQTVFWSKLFKSHSFLQKKTNNFFVQIFWKKTIVFLLNERFNWTDDSEEGTS